MGKEEEEQPPGANDVAAAAGDGVAGGRRGIFCGGRVVRLQCVAAVVLGLAVLLSAVFWLPPFARGHGGARGREPGNGGYSGIVASFRLQKTVAELHENTSKLEYDIYEEIGVPNSTVVVNSLEPLAGTELTTVVFSIVPFQADDIISPTWMSILRSSFMSLVVQQSTLHLTESVFGNSSSFEVLKFPGGITIIPPQTAFLLQRPHASFNFTLNFPIYIVRNKTEELKEQMKAGLSLNSYENLYVKLTNLDGSTVDPPTIVQTSIVLEVGNHQPSVPRMKQLAQTITNSSAGNLGLNNRVFGRVKQISLSTYLRHSLNSGGSAGAPSPAPQHHFSHQHHHHHHHHHHSRPVEWHASSAPGPGPSSGPGPGPRPAPTQQPRYRTPTPTSCHHGYLGKPKSSTPVPAAEPVAAAAAHHHSSSPAASPLHVISAPSVRRTPPSPSVHANSPAPSPPVLSRSPLPAVYFAHSHPPTRAVAGAPSIVPAPNSSSAPSLNSCCRTLVAALCIMICLL